jgi:predicted metal-dependent RNase
MSNFRIVKGIESALSNNKKLVDIEFLGIGGAFDIEEGMSSALLKTRNNKLFLIDCGFTSYFKLKKRELINSVDKVFITHCHEDHCSGLSTFIYDRFFIHGMTTDIECTPEVAVRVKGYLDICGHPEEQYTISVDKYLYIDEDAISITKVDTTKHHWPVNNFPNSGLIFHFDTGDSHEDYAVLIYSGDINVPITSLMDPSDYSFVYEKPENVFIFHDMTSLVHERNPHTNFELLIPVKEIFNNLFTYHHDDKQVAIINQANPEMALTSLIVQGEDFVIEEMRGV